ncbi:MAG TPA: tetraacyldisaccharide 4'-kinase [Prolixibacteraceae bacterium]|jgi:tetraacyldisaccharide 4'-kinase|nr:tetraacyldisaccharide 4'-kinase [Prolixibacteraceae bacterium]
MRKLALYPLSLVYGFVMSVRNWLYDLKILKSVDFDAPVISIGNITVGGTGKTPHTEYLVRLLKSQFRVATLSRGYKRKTKGFLLVQTQSEVTDVGDEPLQVKKKFPSVTVSVCEDRVAGLNQLFALEASPDVVLLDDAFQHRRVTPGLNVLLIDYNKPLRDDHILPYGRLRESPRQIRRANIIIITKCPGEITPITRRIMAKEVFQFPYQQLFFTTMVYGQLYPYFPEGQPMDLFTDTSRMGILLVTGIASPEYVVEHVKKLSQFVDTVLFPDHHYYTENDIQLILQKFYRLQGTRRILITTEKDMVRLTRHDLFTVDVKSSFYILPIQVKFLDREGKLFDQKILEYVGENKSNRELHIRKSRDKV